MKQKEYDSKVTWKTVVLVALGILFAVIIWAWALKANAQSIDSCTETTCTTLKLSHVCNNADGTEFHFIVSPRNSPVSRYGQVAFNGGAGGTSTYGTSPFDWIAPWQKHTGEAIHYSTTITPTVTVGAVYAATVTIDGETFTLHNPDAGEHSIGPCAPTAVTLSSFRAAPAGFTTSTQSKSICGRVIARRFIGTRTRPWYDYTVIDLSSMKIYHWTAPYYKCIGCKM